MWEVFIHHNSIEAIMHDKGLAKVGDNLVNLCYSLAKSMVLRKTTGEKVRDSILAQAIRATDVYSHMNRRTDAGKAADAYEAILAYLWLSEKITIQEIVKKLSENLEIDNNTSRKREGTIAAVSFQILLEDNTIHLPK